MAKAKILVVEDEQDIQELVVYNLTKENYSVVGAETGEKALQEINRNAPDLVVLDLMLPGMDGLDVCKWIKQNKATQEICVLILTAKGDEADIVTGLELGADDYMTKPFSPKVLSAKIKALLRREKRKADPKPGPLEREDLSIHPGKREARIKGVPVVLTPMEFEILHFLATHQGWAYTRGQIVAAVRGENFAVTDRSVDTLIVGLRKKMGEASHYIETVRGVGYRFKEADQ